jgi:hypothetical protein
MKQNKTDNDYDNNERWLHRQQRCKMIRIHELYNDNM